LQPGLIFVQPVKGFQVADVHSIVEFVPIVQARNVPAMNGLDCFQSIASQDACHENIESALSNQNFR
jgi:hypothetical protein